MSAAIGTRGISPTEKLLLIALANYADADDQCWPSNRRLCADTELSERTIRNGLKSLADAGLIERHERNRENGSRSADLFTLRLWAARAAGGGGANGAEGGGQSLPGGGANAAPPEPSIEPKKEKKTPSESKKTASRLPTDWTPTDTDMAYALGKGIPKSRAELMAEKFRNYWVAKSGPGATKLDWGYTWQNWVLTELERNPNLAKPPDPGMIIGANGERRQTWI